MFTRRAVSLHRVPLKTRINLRSAEPPLLRPIVGETRTFVRELGVAEGTRDLKIPSESSAIRKIKIWIRKISNLPDDT